MRYPAEVLLELLAAGMTTDEALADYPALETDDLPAVLEYAAVVTSQRTTIPFVAA